MKFPGVYADTRAQDTIEWIALATIFVCVCAIVFYIVYPKVGSKAHTIESIWSIQSP